MIPRDYITEWRERAPWNEDFQADGVRATCPAPSGRAMERGRLSALVVEDLGVGHAPLADQGD